MAESNRLSAICSGEYFKDPLVHGRPRTLIVRIVLSTRLSYELKVAKYFELYKNGAFPIDLEMAKSDHDFLDNDVCKAFLRRLKVLNKYSTIVIPNRDILRRQCLQMIDLTGSQNSFVNKIKPIGYNNVR